MRSILAVLKKRRCWFVPCRIKLKIKLSITQFVCSCKVWRVEPKLCLLETTKQIVPQITGVAGRSLRQNPVAGQQPKSTLNFNEAFEAFQPSSTVNINCISTMLAARDQENLVHGHQQAAAVKPLNQTAKTPGNRYPKTPLKIPLRDENAPEGLGGKSVLGTKGKSLGNDVTFDKNAFVTPMGRQFFSTIQNLC